MIEYSHRTATVAIGLLAFFGLAALQCGVWVAALITLSLMAGYANVFHVPRPLLALVRRSNVTTVDVAILVATFCVDALLIHQGFGVILAGASVGVLILYVVLLLQAEGHD